MKREIIAYKGYFKEFFDRLDTGTQDKILYVLMLLQTQDRIPLKFMKLIEEGLYELRIEYQSNIYRIFFCFDEGRIVILFNGFQKKTEKTPKKEIEKAYDAVRCCPLKSNDMAMKYEIQIIALTDKLGNKLDDNKIQEIPEIVQEILKNVKKRNAMLS